MSSTSPAVEGVGKKVLIILNDEIIGKGTTQIARGDEYVGVRFEEGKVLDMIKDLETVKVLTLRHSYFRYLPYTGAFWGPPTVDEDDRIDDILSPTFIVDEFNLGYGIVPDHFSKVEGYKSQIKGE